MLKEARRTMEKHPPTEWRVLARRALGFVRPHRTVSLVILGLALLVAVLGAVEPLLLRSVFDALGATDPLRPVFVAVAGLLAIALTREAVGTLSNWLSWRVRLALQRELLEKTVGRLQSLPVAFHAGATVGSTLTRLDRGISGFVGMLSEIATAVLPSIAYLAIALAVMFRLDWRLALLAIAFAPLPALIGMRAAPEQAARERSLLDRWAGLYSRFGEVLSGIVTVKSYTMEAEEKRRFLQGVRQANAVVARGVATDASVGAAKNAVAALARVAVIGVGALFVARGELSLGTLVAFIGYVGGLFGPVQGLTGVYQTLRKGMVSLETVFSILDAADDLGDAPDARALGRVRGEVDFEAVRFGYDGRRPVLNGIDLRVAAGETIAIVGPSGGGKSTMMALLQRLYDPVAGVVRVDGMDLRTVKQRSLRRQIGVVMQDSLLFNDTIAHNIAYGRPGAGPEAIEAAARAANAHDFIMGLPDGYDTIAGERGGSLSMGERQRVAIARALLKDPPILILDEATSALDAESEALVQEAVARLVAGRTTFIIAHRLVTVAEADRILVLRDGRIAEEGTHAQLMMVGGYYASLVHRQTKGLLVEAA